MPTWAMDLLRALRLYGVDAEVKDETIITDFCTVTWPAHLVFRVQVKGKDYVFRGTNAVAAFVYGVEAHLKRPETFEELQALFPDGELGEDNDGQLIIYTNLRVRDDGFLEVFDS